MTAHRSVRAAIAGGVAALAFAVAAPQADAQERATRPTLNFYGVAGLIDMPTGEALPDSQFSATLSRFAGITRGTLSFQPFPWLSASFRYSGIEDFNFGGFSTFYDRSFDVSARLLRERRWWPAVVVGLQDFAGTGISAAEYVVATKHVLPDVKVTAGLGWGRLGSFGALGTPFGARGGGLAGLGGKFEVDEWFRGPVAAFGGIEWQPTERLGFKVEYSSDAYVDERGLAGGRRAGSAPIFERNSSWNFGVEYQVNETLRVGGYYLYGSELGLALSFTADPRRRTEAVPQSGPGPLPVAVRPAPGADPAAWSEAWVTTPGRPEELRDAVGAALSREGIALTGMTLGAKTAQVRIENRRYNFEPQAIGRTARVLSRTLPASVETFEIVPVEDGLTLSAVRLRRSDIEALEHAPGGDATLRARAEIGDAAGLGPTALAGTDPALSWRIGPYLRASYFDPDQPLRLEGGIRASGAYRVAPGLFLSGSLAKPLAGNLDDSARLSNSVLPHVRTDQVLFDREGDPAIERLTAAYYLRPAPNVYGRVSAGYLERMFGGVSAEVLWKPVDSPLAFGAEVNYARKRDFDQLFGFQSYDVVTGHLSAYYEFGDGYLGQVDVGRYLAGDYGATFTFERAFANGWKFAAFATFTDVSAAEFGEGSFDKGVRLEIPLDWIAGRPSRNSIRTTLRPVQRDGGARLNVDGRLYGVVRDYDAAGIDDRWGRVWR